MMKKICGFAWAEARLQDDKKFVIEMNTKDSESSASASKRLRSGGSGDNNKDFKKGNLI